MSENDKYIHDAYMAMAERTIRRLWILCLVIFLAFVTSIVFLIYQEQQFETITQEVTQETEDSGVNNFYGGDYYGEADN
jgi:hypothetical protein